MAAGDRGVVVDDDVLEAWPGTHSEERTGDPEPQVVEDRDPLRGLARAFVVSVQDDEPTRGIPHDIASKDDVLDDRPGCPAALVAGREQHRRSGVIFEQVPFDEDALRILELEQVLYGPLRPGKARIAGEPAEGLEDMVPADLDVGGDQAAGGRIRAAKHDVLGRALEEVVEYLEWARAVVAQDDLGVGARRVYLGNMRVDDGGRGTVEEDPPPGRQAVLPMDIAAIEDQIVRGVGIGALVAAECDDGVDVLDTWGRGELHPDEAIVMSAG